MFILFSVVDKDWIPLDEVYGGAPSSDTRDGDQLNKFACIQSVERYKMCVYFSELILLSSEGKLIVTRNGGIVGFPERLTLEEFIECS